MTAFNVVRFRVKSGREQEFLDAHKRVQAIWPGLKQANMIKADEHTYCTASGTMLRTQAINMKGKRFERLLVLCRVGTYKGGSSVSR